MTASAKSPESRDERAERLAAALRQNLKRRKAQARSQAQAKENEQKPAPRQGAGREP